MMKNSIFSMNQTQDSVLFTLWVTTALIFNLHITDRLPKLLWCIYTLLSWRVDKVRIKGLPQKHFVIYSETLTINNSIDISMIHTFRISIESYWSTLFGPILIYLSSIISEGCYSQAKGIAPQAVCDLQWNFDYP